MNERTIDEINTDERLDSLERRMDAVEEAFPSKDPVGHRRYHELQIEMLEERRKLVAAVKEKTISGLVWSAIIGIGLLCWNEFVSIVKAIRG